MKLKKLNQHVCNFSYMAVVLAFFLFLHPAHAEVVGWFETHPEKGLSEVSGIIEQVRSELMIPYSEVLGVFDWDKTISNKDGSNIPREDVPNLMQYFAQNKIHSMVLSNRYKGLKISAITQVLQRDGRSAMLQMTADMHLKLHLAMGIDNENPLRKFAFTDCSFASQSNNMVSFNGIYGDTYILINNIMFAGTQQQDHSNKGDALKQIIDAEHVSKNSKSKLIVVMDDLAINLVRIAGSFSNRAEKVLLILVHHPESKEKNTHPAIKMALNNYKKIALTAKENSSVNSHLSDSNVETELDREEPNWKKNSRGIEEVENFGPEAHDGPAMKKSAAEALIELGRE